MVPRNQSIAVCITSYNQREYLIQAINSVLAQTRIPDQIIVVDDHSDDGTDTVLRQFELDYPHLFTVQINPSNIGVAVNRHIAITLSRCDLTTYLDGDDVYYSEKLRLEEQCLLENPRAGFVYSNMNLIDEASYEIRTWTSDPDNLPCGDILESLIGHQFPSNIQCRYPLTDTQSLCEATKHSQSFDLYEDLAIFIHLSQAMSCAVVDRINHGYRQHPSYMHRTHHDNHFNAIQEIYRYFSDIINCENFEHARLKEKSNQVLSSYAWRAIRDHSKEIRTRAQR
ncbi:MAG: glycosyltransferase [Phycisphaerales bacterium]|nr:glycosyltransferase [Phycisphaerales bacterium]